MPEKIYLNLVGGLGNQLFQIAAGYAYAQRNGRQLHVLYRPQPDRYGRTLLVDQLLGDELRQQIVFQSKSEMGLVRRASRKIRRQIWPANYLEEDVRSPERETRLDRAAPRGAVELFGFWQDEEFFLPVIDHLRQQIRIDLPLEGRYREMQQQIEQTESVCLGVRLYEDNQLDQTDQAEQSFRQLIESADRLEAIYPQARFFLFSSSHNRIIDELCGGRPNYILARTGDGFGDTLPTLQLMSHCQHHIFNQSTYYWWAAWLSETRHGQGRHLILPPERLFSASRSGIPPRWVESARALA
ncbi:MAG: alpha-1,2-fucosyltransferase [Mariniblastus sp.]|nr:alpha-1,2-fucosyltransferase [Mariniblastus sp.]